jgi:cytochrome c-type biogenesis protein CcmH/NrfG
VRTDSRGIWVPRDLLVQVARALYRQGDDRLREQVEDLLDDRAWSDEARRTLESLGE